MGWTEDRQHHLLIVLVFSAIIALIACAAYLTQPDWGFQASADNGARIAAPVLGSEGR